jgi:hypothetical protein
MWNFSSQVIEKTLMCTTLQKSASKSLFSLLPTFAMASEETSFDPAEKAWKDYELAWIKLEGKSKKELSFLLSEKKKTLGESGVVPESLTKHEILDMILVPVMKPVGTHGLLSYQQSSSSSSSESSSGLSSAQETHFERFNPSQWGAVFIKGVGWSIE